MQECSVVRLHRLETQSFLSCIGCKDPVLSLICLRPSWAVSIELERGIRVRYVVVLVCCRIDIERIRKPRISLHTKTFVVALQRDSRRPRVCCGSTTLDLLLSVLAFTRDECLCLAWTVFLAGIWCVTWLHVDMIARLPCFHTGLAAMRTWDVDIFALAITMAQLATLVKTTLEFLAARLATSWLLKPAWLVLECLLPANAPLLHEKRALGTVLVVCMAVVGNLRVSTWS